jgi:hypothetical protein
MAVSLIARKYNGYYAQRPVLTTMITNAVRVLAATTLHALYRVACGEAYHGVMADCSADLGWYCRHCGPDADCCA